MTKNEYIALYGSIDGWDTYKHHNWTLRKDDYIKVYGIEAWEKESIKRAEKAKVRKYKYHHCTRNGNAESKISGYKKSDKAKGFECTITKAQLIELQDKGCYYCGETDWHKLGADRIDNTKGHTIDNCICSCERCNKQRGNMPFRMFSFLKQHPNIKDDEYEIIIKKSA